MKDSERMEQIERAVSDLGRRLIIFEQESRYKDTLEPPVVFSAYCKKEKVDTTHYSNLMRGTPSVNKWYACATIAVSAMTGLVKTPTPIRTCLSCGEVTYKKDEKAS